MHHAYGPAGDIPGLLARVTPAESDPVWDELWSRLCHQGTVYPASVLALPDLLALARRWPPSQRTAPLALAAGIVAATDGAQSADADILAGLEEAAAESLSGPGLDHVQVVHVAQAVLSFRGDRLWGRQLDRYATGEFPGVCRGCACEFFIVIAPGEYFVAREDYVRRPDVARTPIEPASVEPATGLPEVARWLSQVAAATRDTLLAHDVRYLFGTVQCPGCGMRSDVPNAIGDAC